MYTLITFCLLGAALGLPLESSNAVQSNEHYVLPGESSPTIYDVRLFFNPDNEASFNGQANIRIIPNNSIRTIVLQAMEMRIQSITLFAVANPSVNLTSSYSQANDDTHFLRIESTQLLAVSQPYIVDIQYVGTYGPNMFGVYVSNYQYLGQPYKLITSQLQPTYARRVFPCYDEPHLKAVFKITIYAPAQYAVVRTNMPLRSDTSKPEVVGYVKHEFQDTPIMSTYLLAFLVSNFQYISNEGIPNPIYNVPFRIYSRRGTQNTAEFALDFGQKNMVALQNYIQFDYALPKFDKVAVPDFGAGAMENWGLVVYREVALLVQDGVTTTSTKQNVGRIICHENVHMWFGNEVSPRSWTYTWLNEGFANFFENFGTDLVLPEWRMMDQFVLLLQNVLQSDAVLSVNPMTHAVYTPSEVIGTFNAVAYQKSGSVIRMMQHFLTPEVFQRGLIIYIRNNSRQAARPADLYAALQQALDNSEHSIPYRLANVMARWTQQGGFPVITVRRSSPSANSISLHQTRYLTDASLSSTDSWHVPVNWVLSTNVDFSDTRPLAWVPPASPALSVDIPGFNQVEWYIVNKQQTGYYRVNYDEGNWRALANVLQRSHQIIHLLNRAQLVDDSFNLARNGRLQYAYAFDVSRYLINETDYIPWGSANSAFDYLDVVLSGSRAYPLFQKYILGLSQPLYNRLGFQAANNEEHVTAFHRNLILNLNCRHGNQHCVNTSQELLQNLRNNPNQNLNPDIQTTVFCSGLRGGSTENFNFLWNRYLASQDSSEQSVLLSALGCTSDASLRNFYMRQVIDDSSSVRDQDRHSVLVSIINSSPAGMEAALDFIIENFALIQPKVQQLTGTTNILNALARRLSTQAHAQKIQAFEIRHSSIFSAGERAAIAGIRENIAASIAWTENNYNLVNSWLDDNYGEQDDGGNSASGLASGFVVMISLLAAIYNR